MTPSCSPISNKPESYSSSPEHRRCLTLSTDQNSGQFWNAHSHSNTLFKFCLSFFQAQKLESNATEDTALCVVRILILWFSFLLFTLNLVAIVPPLSPNTKLKRAKTNKTSQQLGLKRWPLPVLFLIGSNWCHHSVWAETWNHNSNHFCLSRGRLVFLLIVLRNYERYSWGQNMQWGGMMNALPCA